MDYYDAYGHDEVAARELEAEYWADAEADYWAGLEAQFDADLADRITAEYDDTEVDAYDVWIDLWDCETFGTAALRDMYDLDEPCAWTDADQFDHELAYVLAYS